MSYDFLHILLHKSLYQVFVTAVERLVDYSAQYQLLLVVFFLGFAPMYGYGIHSSFRTIEIDVMPWSFGGVNITTLMRINGSLRNNADMILVKNGHFRRQ